MHSMMLVPPPPIHMSEVGQVVEQESCNIVPPFVLPWGMQYQDPWGRKYPLPPMGAERLALLDSSTKIKWQYPQRHDVVWKAEEFSVPYGPVRNEFSKSRSLAYVPSATTNEQVNQFSQSVPAVLPHAPTAMKKEHMYNFTWQGTSDICNDRRNSSKAIYGEGGRGACQAFVEMNRTPHAGQ